MASTLSDDRRRCSMNRGPKSAQRIARGVRFCGRCVICYTAWRTFTRNRSRWARPNIWRLRNLRRLTWPSVVPLLQGKEQAARTAAESRRMPLTKLLSSATRLSFALLPPPISCRHLAFFEQSYTFLAQQVDGVEFLMEVHLLKPLLLHRRRVLREIRSSKRLHR